VCAYGSGPDLLVSCKHPARAGASLETARFVAVFRLAYAVTVTSTRPLTTTTFSWTVLQRRRGPPDGPRPSKEAGQV